ncbi:MAG: sarcosine oxidase subunit alpha family protein [Alphaproteobacteria bacterium]|nr:sarcosine oxidase subunit alpha family protein [Alphaproteobacteria bacterium]
MSNKPYRVPTAGTGGTVGRVIDRSQMIDFQWNGRKYAGYEGDTLASALFANGIRVVGRSFKYHRPRGVLGFGSNEPNALVGVGSGNRQEPNLRATQVELHAGLTASAQNAWPSVEFDVGQVNSLASRLFPSGFYYKTFMWPQSFWKSVYEPIIRRAAGLGVAPEGPDPDTYEQFNCHCDVLVVGGGAAGLAAAEAASANGARVIIADENPQFGGISDIAGGTIGGEAQSKWIAATAASLAKSGNVHVMNRTTVVGHYHHNYVMMFERVAEHDPNLLSSGAPRHRLWKVRAKQVIIASGAIERPIPFANNDRPGVMLSTSVRAHLARYGVTPGYRGVVFTNNDDAYRTATDLLAAGVPVGRIIDVRAEPSGPLIEAAKSAGIEISAGSAICGLNAKSGGKHITSVKMAPYSTSGRVSGAEEEIACDFVAVSGGWNPVVHLHCHNGGKLDFDQKLQSFVPKPHADPVVTIGAANGTFGLGDLMTEAYAAGDKAGKAATGSKAAKAAAPKAASETEGNLEAIWFAPATGKYNEGNKHFIDYQNDVTAADLELAQREGYESVEHTKRYTTLGMATDQGKTSNIIGLGVLSGSTGKPIPEIGTTTFRPPYTPFSFGSIAGTQVGKLFHVVRRTALFDWHAEAGATWEPIGDWRRAYCYPKGEEDKHAAINREILTVRNKVGLLDASTLGKIEIKGPDAGALLDRVYTNKFSTLKPGRGRYGLMMNEMGFLFDDGVTVCLGENHYLMHTTSGGAERIVEWLEEWLQTEWTDMKVFVTAVTEQWSQYGVAGPKARALLEKLEGDVDFGADALSFMGMTEGTLAGTRVRVFRISFSGELSYEIAVPSHNGRAFWEKLLEAGEEFGVEPYGTEALHVLRAEKGFIAIGDETDGTVTPLDLGLNWAVSKKKADYLGKRALDLPHLAAENRKELVGLLTEDPNEVLPDGAYAVSEVSEKLPMDMIGQVTSTYWSPTLNRSIAMALVKQGRAKMGQKITFPVADGKVVRAEIVDPVFYDKEGERQNV